MKRFPILLVILLTSQAQAQGPAEKAARKKQEKQAKQPEKAQNQGHKLGYDDTPFLPKSKWRVHDGKRPQPRIVTPGTASTPEQPGKAPSDAIILFDGKDLSKWTGKGGKANWKLKDGYMEVNRTGQIESRGAFGSCQLHIEWASPKEVKGEGQQRGNSGVFLMGRYEIQVLDNYKNQTYPDGQAGSLYGQKPPLVNASRKPGAWQVYDILFTAPRFDGDKLISPAYATVIHNGVVVQNHQPLIGASTHKRVAKYTAHGDSPIHLQDHGNPVRYRNIWLRKLD